MNWQTYEIEKQKLIAKNLPQDLYEKEIKKLTERLKI